jgi:hypothetical protein
MNNGGRIALIVTGAIAALIATALVAGGALALWGDSLKDDDGYLKTDIERFHAGTRALATDNLDVDLGDADFIAQSDDLGKIKVSAESRDDWSVVVMNADGSLGVDADVQAGADIPFLDELGWSAIGSGAFALVLGIGLIALGVRRPKAVAV